MVGHVPSFSDIILHFLANFLNFPLINLLIVPEWEDVVNFREFTGEDGLSGQLGQLESDKGEGLSGSALGFAVGLDRGKDFAEGHGLHSEGGKPADAAFEEEVIEGQWIGKGSVGFSSEALE